MASIEGIAGHLVAAVLTWAAGQVVQLGVAVARGAMNNGVDIYWNWNVFKGPIGVTYSVL